jgi:hypothetical protein
MNRITKVVISLGCNMFSVELAFNLLQRKVFAENKLDLYVLTFDTDAVKEMAEYIKTFGFSNMNGTLISSILNVSNNIYIYAVLYLRYVLFLRSIHRLIIITSKCLFPIN